MNRIIFVSNRLPITINKGKEGLEFKPSIGGLATGLTSVHNADNSLWVGWCGKSRQELSAAEVKEISRRLPEEFASRPVFLTEKELEQYYYGFCNRTVWPLFHYFNNHAVYDHRQWQCYQRVNRKFFSQIAEIISEEDTVWIHDYQLMLLPAMVRKEFPKTKIGFFLHIPFPTYELFRLMPWRTEILQGLLGADLIGFHTYDYVRHFLSSVRRLLGHDHNLGYINMRNRLVKADVFPMGIDYQRYQKAHLRTEVREEISEVFEKVKDTQVVLSVDRLDYTKGIPARLRSFGEFLRKNPSYRGKVTLIMIVAPSRTEVSTYHELLCEIEELVGHINGKYGTIGWMPVWFFYRSFDFNHLTALYSIADVMLVTPLRDGMNLVAKEYIAARDDNKGMLVISETAGAASELSEAVIVNANNIREVAEGIKAALEMPVVDKIARNKIMSERLAHYNVEFWAGDFLRRLDNVEEVQRINSSQLLDQEAEKALLNNAGKARRRLFLLDYDTTLMGFTGKEGNRRPTKELHDLLRRLSEARNNEVLIVSGRNRAELEEWFGDLPVNMAAAHGLWIRKKGGDWEPTDMPSEEWKETIRPMLEMHTARTPGSYIEAKDHSIAWHYHRCEPELATVRVNELKDALEDLTGNLNIGLLNDNRVLEIKDTAINKGRAAALWLAEQKWDFVFAVGDDWSDEDLFAILPETAYSIKVGIGMSHAHYRVESVEEVRSLLRKLAAACSKENTSSNKG